MERDQRLQLYEDCEELFGLDTQMLILAEECSELTKAMLKLHRAIATGQTDMVAISALVFGKVYEEIADVEIMIEQMKESFGPFSREMVGKFKAEKLDRLQERVNEEWRNQRGQHTAEKRSGESQQESGSEPTP